MKRDNIVQIKSFEFAVDMVKLDQRLMSKNKEFILSKQITKSGTSIGANIEEAIGGQSRKDFYAKLSISYKEARETHYWLRILKETGYLSDDDFSKYMRKSEELLKFLSSILKSTRENSK